MPAASMASSREIPSRTSCNGGSLTCSVPSGRRLAFSMIAIGCRCPFVLMPAPSAFNSSGGRRGKSSAAGWMGRTSRHLRAGGLVCIGIGSAPWVWRPLGDGISEAPAAHGRGFGLGGGGCGVIGRLAAAVAALLGRAARLWPLDRARPIPLVNFFFGPRAGVWADHASGRKTVALDAAFQGRPGADDAARFEVAEAKPDCHLKTLPIRIALGDRVEAAVSKLLKSRDYGDIFCSTGVSNLLTRARAK